MRVCTPPRFEQIALEQEIWETVIAEGPPPPLIAELHAAFRRRFAEDHEQPEDPIPWAEVKAKILAGNRA